MTEFKVGDTVKVVDVAPINRNSWPTWNKPMDKYVGMKLTVDNIVRYEGDLCYYLSNGWNYHPDWIEPANAQSNNNVITSVMPTEGQCIAIWEFAGHRWSKNLKIEDGVMYVYDDVHDDEWVEVDWKPNEHQTNVMYILENET
jgi:hypothetical protein